MALDARALTRTARLVLADLDLDAVLPRIVDAAQQMTDATYGALGVLDATGSALERFVTRGVAPEAAQEIGPRPTGQGLLGESSAGRSRCGSRTSRGTPTPTGIRSVTRR